MSRSIISSVIVPTILFGVIAFVAYSAFTNTSDEDLEAAQSSQEASPKLPAELLNCNDIENAEETGSFSTCLEFAEQGYLDAQRKVAWAYTREGDYQDWQRAYYWLNKIAEFDTDIELLSQIVLFLLGDSEEDKVKAESDIRRLADTRYAPAEAYLATLYFLDLNKLPRDANPAWLLRKAYDQDKSMISPFEMATVYANGFGTRQNITKAKQVLVDYANDDFPFAANNVAWFLATLEENSITDGQFVVSLAESAVNDPEYGQRHSFVDTLAASYAADGNFEKAVEVQQQAIDIMTTAASEDIDPSEEIADFEARLELYKNGDRPILESIDVDLDAFFKGLKRDIERILLASLNVYIEPEFTAQPSEATTQQ